MVRDVVLFLKLVVYEWVFIVWQGWFGFGFEVQWWVIDEYVWMRGGIFFARFIEVESGC